MTATQLQSPPRRVPPLLGLQCLFGGFLQQFGWGFYFAGMLMILIFGSQVELPRLLAFKGALQQAPGEVLRAEETSAEVSEVEVVAYVFRYQVDGATYEGRSYSTGFQFEPEDTVTVEYNVAHPEVARIQGTRLGAFPPWIFLLLLLFPMIGFALAWSGLRQGIGWRSLLGRGELALGELSKKEATGARVNYRVVYAMTFTFQPDSSPRPFVVTAQTHHPERLEDQEREQILYDPHNPNTAILLDNLPGAATVTAGGKLSSGRLLGAMWVTMLPLASILITVFTVYALTP